MNNKILKSVIAVFAIVALLGTCAFAATTTGVSDAVEDNSFEFTYTVDSADKIAYVAYAAVASVEGFEGLTAEIGGESYDLTAIIAIDQIDGLSAGSDTVTVKYLEENLGDATHIVVKAGDSLGTSLNDGLIPVVVFNIETGELTYGTTVEIDGVTYEEGVYTANGEATLTGTPAGTTAVVTATVTYDGAPHDATITPATLTNVTIVGGKLGYKIAIINLPEDIDTAKIGITPAISFQ